MRDCGVREFTDIVRRGLKTALDFLIPRTCLVCGCRLEIEQEHLCPDCLDDLPRTYYWLRRFNPMADRFNALIQEEVEKHTDYTYASALFFYRAESEYRRIPYQIKYHGDIPAGRFFGRQLGQTIAATEHFADVDAVIPVPLHWARKWSRGYNQAEIIASEVASILGTELHTNILQRCRRTRTQTKLSIEGKAANVHGAFRVQTCVIDSIKVPKHLLLIDDVFTTGSTLHACYQALRSVFPPEVRISVATLAFVGEE